MDEKEAEARPVMGTIFLVIEAYVVERGRKWHTISMSVSGFTL